MEQPLQQSSASSGAPAGGSRSPSRSFWIIPGVILAGGILGGLIFALGRSLPAPEQIEAISPTPGQSAVPAAMDADAKTQALGEFGSANDLTSIEGDLQATDLSGLDEELDFIGQEVTAE